MHLISRRKLVSSAIAFPAVRTLAQSVSGAGNTPRKLKVVITGGHPGDPEYGCGGTVARYTDLGHEVVMLYLNRGEKGCPEENPSAGSAVRVAEARKACEILKARAAFTAQCDGHAIVDRSRYDEFRVLLAAENPDVLFTHWPIDGHADHRAISMLAYDAWRSLGKKFAFYYYEVSNGADTLMFTPTDYVDIGKTEPRKRAACYAHASQTPDRFYLLQSQVSRFRGIESGFAHAEAFIRHVQSANNFLPD